MQAAGSTFECFQWDRTVEDWCGVGIVTRGTLDPWRETRRAAHCVDGMMYCRPSFEDMYSFFVHVGHSWYASGHNIHQFYIHYFMTFFLFFLTSWSSTPPSINYIIHIWVMRFYFDTFSNERIRVGMFFLLYFCPF